MKINRINNFINFKGSIGKDNHINIFKEMIDSLPIEIKDAPDDIVEVWSPPSKKTVDVPIGRDLVILEKPAVKKIPMPFELSDKKLVLDEYQNRAIESFRNGNNVMVTAPTGTGKTLIAEHIIDDILKSGKKVIYTTPLKALCNDKYKQFSVLWGDYDSNGKLTGKSKVGLATGDAKINAEAPLVVMTTEIYRNMLASQGEKSAEKELKNVDAVIFDEFHYMGDSQRGSVWEEAVMFSPQRMKLLMLSATIANAEPINEWMKTINKDHDSVIIAVPEAERHVPLKYYTFSNIKGTLGLYDLLEEKINLESITGRNLSTREKETVAEIGKYSFYGDGDYTLQKILSSTDSVNLPYFIKELEKLGVPRTKAEQFGLRLSDKNKRYINNTLFLMAPMNQVPLKEFVIELKKQKLMPALYFVYSKKSCKNLMQTASETVGSLLTNEERAEVKKRIDEVKKKGIFLGTDFEDKIKPCLLNGFAMHNSGMLPQCKSFIEELGRNKLVKVCFATDTLGAGINFPFKTVVFSDFEKFSNDDFEEISANTFKQGAGRAGRRGIDDVGYVISIPRESNDVMIPYRKVINASDDVQSAFNLSYSLILSPRFLNNSDAMLERSFDFYQTQSAKDNIKKCEAMKEMLKSHHCVEEKGGKYRLTEKGKIASKVKGINEILLAEMMTSKTMTEGISPQELAELISVFAPDKEDKIVPYNDINSKTYSHRLAELIPMSLKIREKEEKLGIDKGFTINTSTAPYVKLWAKSGTEGDNSVLWTSIVNSMIEKELIKDEGDFFKKINFTVNVLKQLQTIAPTSYLKETAKEAVKRLQKSPVDDILLYELDYKENNE